MSEKEAMFSEAAINVAIFVARPCIMCKEEDYINKPVVSLTRTH